MEEFPKVGQLFDERFEILSALGAGGMGTVFKAIQIDVKRTVAIKILHVGLAVQDEFISRFMREAKALSLLRHENIVTVYHMGMTAGKTLYIAMELANGQNLRKILDNEGKLGAARAIKITRQCAAALLRMHESGIVHRDFKPENIILLSEPEPDFVKLIDFGLAKVNSATSDQKLTATGDLIGSVNYMSPEQCNGQICDQRSDIYALTACFFEMLSGEAPFSADNAIGLMYKHTHEEVPVLNAKMIADFNPLMNQIISTGLAKDPDKRYQSVAEFLEDLENLNSLIDNPGAGFKPASSFLLPMLGVLLVIGIIACVVLKMHAPEISSKPEPATTLKSVRKLKFGTDKALEFESLLDSLNNLRAKGDAMAYLNNAKKAVAIGKELPAGVANLTLAILMLAGCYVEIGDYKEAIELVAPLAGRKLVNSAEDEQNCHYFAALLSNDRRYGGAAVSPQDILEARSITADCYLHLGMKDKAQQILKELVDWPWGLDHSGDTTLSLLLGLDDEKSARMLISHTMKTVHLLSYSEICRNRRYPQLARLCLQKLDPIVSIISNGKRGQELLGPDAQHLHEIKLEHAMLPLADGNLGQTQRELRELVSKSRLVLEKRSNLAKDEYADLIRTLFCMRQAEMYKEALALAEDKQLGMKPMSTLSASAQYRARLVMADLLVLNKQDSQARAILEPGDRVNTTGKVGSYSALSRLERIRSGKIDRTKGLLDVY